MVIHDYIWNANYNVEMKTTVKTSLMCFDIHMLGVN